MFAYAEKYSFEFKCFAVECQLKNILAVIHFPKVPYMYWQKKFAQPDEREQIILAIRKERKDYGYRRLWAQM